MPDPAARPGTPAHDDFEALAAGYALHALEPEDEQLLSAHLVTCPACARLIADTASLGAAFADLIEPETPPPGLRERVLAAAAAEPRGLSEDVLRARRAEREPLPRVAVPPPAVPRPRRSWRRHELRTRAVIGALAAAIAVAVAVPVTLAESHHPQSGNTALAQWLLQRNAREMTLQPASGPGMAKVVVSDKGAYLLAEGLKANERSNSIYVLWAADAQGERRPVATFDVRGAAPVQLTAAKLPFSPAAITGMAVSFETGRKAPAQPTDLVLSSA